MEMNDGASWVMRVHAGNLKRRERRALHAWLAQSSEHARDYLRAETVWRLSGGLATDARVRMELHRLRSTEEPTSHRWPAVGIAACVVALLAVVVWFVASPTITWFETQPGEQRMVTLSDGSTVAINTASRVGVKYHGTSRMLILERGEALFQVNKDPHRPFVVRAGNGYVRALGTRFNVLIDAHQAVTVAVLEGRVEVARDHSTDGHPQTLAAGQSAVYGEDTKPIQAVDLEQASRERIAAWREGKLRFDAWPLARALEEHNRYAVKPIHIGDPALKDVRISGVFRIGDTAALVDALQQLIDVRVRDGDGVLVLTKEEPRPPNPPHKDRAQRSRAW